MAASILQPDGQIGGWLSLDGLRAGGGYELTSRCDTLYSQAGCSGSAQAISKRFVGDPLGPPDVFNGSESPAVKTIYANSHNLIQGSRLRAVD